VSNTTTNTIHITNVSESVSNTTGAMVVSGGVGVGSNLFVGKDLTVSGTMTINAVSLSTTTNLQEVTNDGNTTTNTIEFNNPTTGLVASGNVEVGMANLFVDTTTGNVGVGKTNPGTALEVYSSTGTQLTLSSSSRYTTIYGVDDTGSCFFGNDGGSFRITTGGDTSGTGASEALRVNSSGNVGIGTTSPGFPLDVVFSGDSGIRAKSTSSHASLNLDSDSGYGYIRFQDSGTETVWLQSKPSGDLVIRPQGGNETVLFGANGNVSIGKTNPAYKLDVNGDIVGGCPVLFSANRDGLIAGAQRIVFDDVHYNKGGGYSGTTGIFTAPLSGYYKFSYHDLTQQTTATTYVQAYINGTQSLPNTTNSSYYGVYDNSSDSNYRNMSGNWIVYLNTGDTFELKLVGGRLNSNFNCFNGFYLST
jgi:hypothetical protein